MCNLSNILNIFWLPKYKSKIERKIDALLTITDTLCTHISKSNLNNTSFAYVVQCAFLLPLLFLSLELFWALSVAWKKMSWKSVNLVFGACATILHDSCTPTPSHRQHELILFRCFVTPSKRCNIKVLLWYVCEGAVICTHVSYKTGKE